MHSLLKCLNQRVDSKGIRPQKHKGWNCKKSYQSRLHTGPLILQGIHRCSAKNTSSIELEAMEVPSLCEVD